MDDDTKVNGEGGWDCLAGMLLAAATGLCLFTGLSSLITLSQAGPDVGEIVAFNPRNGPRYWDQPGIIALYTGPPGSGQDCILMPSVMANGGGSLVIEAKEISDTPIFHVHWSGSHTDLGHQDCGQTADLKIRLPDLHALAMVAGGFGVTHRWGMF